MAEKGQRVKLIHTSDRYTRLKPGTLGTIILPEDSQGTVHVQWDDGSSLGMIPGHDSWVTISEDEDTA